jgi:DNA repair exonuclease SbcCD nuclease subunit
LAGEVDLVVHGGDVFHRPRVPKSLVFQAFEPLKEVAGKGVPVFVVPGNHERSRIPHLNLASHPGIHIFSEPGTRRVRFKGNQVAVTGFPYVRKNVRGRFPGIIQGTEWDNSEDSLRILAMHHCVEGATVGPADFTFTNSDDVVRCRDLPPGFAAVLSGHIHRQQVLTSDLQGAPLPTPVLYPGSVERTAFAEKDEEKGFMILTFEAGENGGQVTGHEFRSLATRPMVEVTLEPKHSAKIWSRQDLVGQLRGAVEASPSDSVLRIRLHGRIPQDLQAVAGAASLRSLAPPSMNLDLITPERQRSIPFRGRRRGASKEQEQTTLVFGG